MKVCKIIVTALILVTMSVENGLSQGSFGGGMKVKTKVEKSDDGGSTKDNDRAKLQQYTGKSNINPQVKPKLYRDIRKVYGRYVGVGEAIPESEKQHYRLLFRLSEQNMAGSWTKVEALNYDGDLTTRHNIGTYILNQNDEGDSQANKEWQEKLKSVCQWSIMYDATGLTVVQERAYDAKGNLIFTYSPMKISENEVVGTYSNCWGIPVNLRGKHGATLVKIKWDDKGNEVEHVFVDEKGRLIKNQNGAYISRFEYDAAGNRTLNMSCDEFGDPMLDNCGNCGLLEEYDKCHNVTKTCYLDEKMRPMKMPVNERNKSSDYQGVSRVSREYDKWQRVTSETFTDEKGEPDTNAFGFHKVKYEYDSHGNLTWARYYGTDGQTSRNSSFNGAGIFHKEYDRWGNLCLVEFFGKDTTERVNGGNNGEWCKWESNNVDREETYDRYREYVMRGGMMACRYSYEKKGNIAIQVFSDSTMRVDSFDLTGLMVSEVHIDRDGKPYEPVGYHKMVSSRQKVDNNVTYTVKRWFGADFKPVDWKNAAVEEVETDSMNRTVRTKRINSRGVIVDHFKTYRDEKWKIVREENLNFTGNIACTMRTGSRYILETKLSFDGEISDVYSKNEFGESTYSSNNRVAFCHYRQMGDSTICYDEDGNEIQNQKQFRSTLPVAFIVEVTESVGYDNGLRDGDVILQYGDWRYDLTLPEDVKRVLMGSINGAFVAEATRKKTMRVLRHDAEHNRSEIVTLNLGVGRIDELGFNSHAVYYTKKEYHRLQTALNQYVDRNGLRGEWHTSTSQEIEYACIVPECSNSMATQLLYRCGQYAPMMILAIDRYLVGDDMNGVPSPGNQWVTGDEAELMNTIILNSDNAKVAKHKFYVTKDGKSIDTLSFVFSDMQYRMGETVANEDIYIVRYDGQFSENVKELMIWLNSGALGFKRSATYKPMEYITLDELLRSDAYSGMKVLTMKDDGNVASEIVLLNSELRKTSVDSIVVLKHKAQDMKMVHRLKSVMEGYEVVCEVVDGSLVYECSKGKKLRRVLMVNLNKEKVSMMMYCDMERSEFNPERFVHSLDNIIEAAEGEIIRLMRIRQDGDIGDKEKHLNGEYVVLEFEGWNMYESRNVFLSNVRMAAGKSKACVIVPIKRDKSGKLVKVGKPEIRKIDNFAGWYYEIDEMLDWEEVAEAYEKWKAD